jgi:hypothetical protein
MAKATNETDPAVLAAFDAMIAGVKGVERKGAGMPYVSLNGNMYGMINRASTIGLRLDTKDLAAFFATYGASPFEGTPGFVNKAYAAIPAAMLRDGKALQAWFKRSHAYAGRLKPKPTTR